MSPPPPRVPVLNAWLPPAGNKHYSGRFWRHSHCDLAESSRGGRSLRVSCSWSLLPLSLLPVHHEARTFSATCPHCRDILPKLMEPNKCGLDPLKSCTRIRISLLKIVSLRCLSQLHKNNQCGTKVRTLTYGFVGKEQFNP